VKTDDFIDALSHDAPVAEHSPRRAMAIAVAGGVLVAGALLMLTLHPRPDFSAAMRTMRFDFKFVVTLLLAGTAFLVLRDMARPEIQRSRLRAALLAAPVLLLLGVGLEMIAIPRELWMPRMVGHNMRFCTTFIPLFSLGPLALMLWALRRGAPARPVWTGAMAGLVAGGIGAAFYAAHCFDDSPLFVAVWYTLAIAFVAGLGALLGSRFLRW
jgi:hypothetical protein